MPIYGYRCTQCGHEMEVTQSISDKPLRVCPVCMGPLQKQLYPVGVIFKGSGFYTTDYKSSGRSDGKSGSGDSSGASKESGTKEKSGSKEKAGSKDKASSSD